MKEKNEELKAKEALALLGGGQKQIDKQYERGKLSARKRTVDTCEMQRLRP